MSASPRVSAVSFLNTAPLVWGLLHGPQKGKLDVRFVVPSECADDLRDGRADIGLVPIIELARQPQLSVIPGGLIGCRGPVRSILLVSKRPVAEIKTLAADTSSRTSVVLTELVLRSRGVRDLDVRPHAPELDRMLSGADAALVIGDPALRIDPDMSTWQGQSVEVHDIGAAWVEMTGLPMVFAVWAGKEPIDATTVDVFEQSKAYGLDHIDDIVAAESASRSFAPELVRQYVTEYISYEFGARERRAIDLYLEMAAEAGLAPRVGARYLESAVAAAQEQN